MAKSNAFTKKLKQQALPRFTVRDTENHDCGQFDTLEEATKFVREDLENNPHDGYTLYIDKLVLVGKVHKPEPKIEIEIITDPEA